MLARPISRGRVILFSTSSTDFKTYRIVIARASIPGTKSRWTPAIGLWKEILRLSDNKGIKRNIYWKVVGTLPNGVTVESKVRSFRVGDPQAVTINRPSNEASLPESGAFTFDFNTNCNVRFRLEFSRSDDFKKATGFAVTTKDHHAATVMQGSLTPGQWNVVKKLVGAGTGYFRIKAWDRIKRQTISEVRSFTIQKAKSGVGHDLKKCGR